MGLEYIHAHNIIHHDLKPDNILIGEDGKLKICDFGVSMLTQSKDEKSTAVRGTPPYLAPEVILKRAGNNAYAGRPVDIWALGVTLYQFLFGRLPFKGPTIPETFNLIVNKRLALPTRVSPHLQNFLVRILCKDPEKRITIPEMKVHPWLTVDGQWPFPAQEHLVEVSSEEIEKALTHLAPLTNIVGLKIKVAGMARKARERAQQRRANGETLSRSPSAASLPSEDEMSDGEDDEEIDETKQKAARELLREKAANTAGHFIHDLQQTTTLMGHPGDEVLFEEVAEDSGGQQHIDVPLDAIKEAEEAQTMMEMGDLLPSSSGSDTPRSTISSSSQPAAQTSSASSSSAPFASSYAPDPVDLRQQEENRRAAELARAQEEMQRLEAERQRREMEERREAQDRLNGYSETSECCTIV